MATLLRVSWTKRNEMKTNSSWKRTRTHIRVCVCLCMSWPVFSIFLAAFGFPFQYMCMSPSLSHTHTHTNVYKQTFAPTDAHNFPQTHTHRHAHTHTHTYDVRACKRSIAYNENGRNLAHISSVSSSLPTPTHIQTYFSSSSSFF